MTARLSLPILMAAALAAGAAQAQVAETPVRMTFKADPLTSPTAAEASLRQAAFAPRRAERELRVPGIAKTAVDQRLGPEGLTGALGVLCGIKPGADRFAAHGHDPNGRFVGAKLSLAFR